MRTFILAAGLVSTSPTTADQFDLICATEARHLPNAKWRLSDPLHYRVDLTARRWCSGACNQIEAVHYVNDNVVFFRSHRRQGPLDDYLRELVHRQTGELSIVMIGGGPLGSFLEFRGQCKRAKFTGFATAGRD